MRNSTLSELRSQLGAYALNQCSDVVQKRIAVWRWNDVWHRRGTLIDALTDNGRSIIARPATRLTEGQLPFGHLRTANTLCRKFLDPFRQPLPASRRFAASPYRQ